MATIFKADERNFVENPGRIDGFRLMTDVSIASAGLKTRNLNFDLRRLNPGEYSSLYHFHHNAEELFMIVSGSATLRTPECLETVGAGDLIFFETGATGAHQMHNHTDEPCIYLDVRTFDGCDVAEYPDSGRLLLIPAWERLRKDSRTGNFDGEENPGEVWKNLKHR